MRAPKFERLKRYVGFLRQHPRWLLVLLILLIGCLYIFWAAFFSQSNTKREGMGRPMPVALAQASKGDIEVHIDALGTVTPQNVVTVRSRIDGQLMRLGFREGQLVKAGQVLAEIDPRPNQVLLAQAIGQYEKDKALLDNATVDLARYKKLIEQESISRQQLDTQAALVRQYQGTLAVDRGAVDNAKLQLAYTRIAAPMSGRVGLRQVDPGNMIKSSDTNGLLVITQLQPINVVFSMPQDNIGAVMQRIAAGEKLVVKAFDREQKKELAIGELLTVDNQIDTTTGTVKLKAQFANADFSLFPNQFVNVRLRVETRKDVVLIPSAAVQRGKGNMTYVYVAKDDKTVTVREIKLGAVEGELSSVLSGLTPGENVVADGADKLREGAKIEVPAVAAEGKAASAEGAGEAKGENKRRKKEGAAPATPAVSVPNTAPNTPAAP